MRRFYALVAATPASTSTPRGPRTLEVEWWRVHREHQRDGDVTNEELVGALVDLYAYVYSATPTTARRGPLAVEAMDLSDAWVAAGADLAHPLLPPSGARSSPRMPPC